MSENYVSPRLHLAFSKAQQSEGPPKRDDELKAAWHMSLELETQKRLLKDFTDALCKEGSQSALVQWHRHMINMQNNIMREVTRRATGK